MSPGFIKLKSGYLILFCFIFFISGAYAQEGYGKIKVIVEGLSNSSGEVRIGLYNNKEGYYSRGDIASFRSAAVVIINHKAEFTFARVPFAEYTIKVFHDENANGKLDLGILGIPKEKYGFSNNPGKTLGLAPYDKVKFNLSSEELVLKINLR